MKLSAEYQEARIKWEAVRAEHKAAQERLEDAQLALRFAQDPPDEVDAAASKLSLERAARFLAGRTLTERQLRRLTEDLEDEEQLLARRLKPVREAWEAARGRESARVVGLVRPRHFQVVGQMAVLVQQLSDLVARERELRASIGEATGLPSAALPDAGAEFGDLVDYNSRLSAWARRMRQAGALR